MAPSVSYYSPGMIHVVGQDQQVKPGHYSAGAVPSGQQAVAEQYGQPESASIPANYKPFGSWGLYIGGNPADGYYTNYYKSLTNSVEKQVGGSQPVQPAEPASGGQQVKPGQSAAFSGPMVRQAGGPNYVVGPIGTSDFYPFDNSYYTPADLNSGSSRFVTPMQAGSSVYGTPSASYEPGSSLSYAPDSPFSTKRSGSQQALKEPQAPLQQQQKSYQARAGYIYSPVVQASGHQVGGQQHQVVAYPVPVGSQIVGSQPGVEGSFQPYGVHAFTRYAVKPTVVTTSTVDQQYYSAPSMFPSYKQQSVSHYAGQPMSFYGYPLSQLHYSAGSLSPSSVVHHSSVPSGSSVSGSSSPVGSVVGQQSSGVVGASPVESVSAFHHQGPHSPVNFVGQPVEVGVAAASEKSETSVTSSTHTNAQDKAHSHHHDKMTAKQNN